MKFGSGDGGSAKAWKDIWGSGQGIGAIDRVRPAAELVDILAAQYAEAKARISAASRADCFERATPIARASRPAAGVDRSTMTWTKWPSAAASRRPAAKMPIR